MYQNKFERFWATVSPEVQELVLKELAEKRRRSHSSSSNDAGFNPALYQKPEIAGWLPAHKR